MSSKNRDFARIAVVLRNKCPYSQLFRSVFSRIWTEYGPKLSRIRTLFMQCHISHNCNPKNLQKGFFEWISVVLHFSFP